VQCADYFHLLTSEMDLSMKFSLFAAVAFVALVATAPVQASTGITYQGSDSLAGFDINYTIVTNGALGTLAIADILSSKITFVGSDASNPKTVTLNGLNTFYFANTNSDNTAGVSPVTATATNLLFDFAGAGGLNFCDDSYVACYAFAPAHATDTDSVVYHGTVLLPVKEVDNTSISYNLQPNTFTSVSATTQVFGVAAVPEPATWAMLLAGFGMIGATQRRQARRLIAA